MKRATASTAVRHGYPQFPRSALCWAPSFNTSGTCLDARRGKITALADAFADAFANAHAPRNGLCRAYQWRRFCTQRVPRRFGNSPVAQSALPTGTWLDLNLGSSSQSSKTAIPDRSRFRLGRLVSARSVIKRRQWLIPWWYLCTYGPCPVCRVLVTAGDPGPQRPEQPGLDHQPNCPPAKARLDSVA